MTDLAEQQQSFLHALFDWPTGDAVVTLSAQLAPGAARGIWAYRTNGHVLAQRTLAVAYPVMVRLLGEESFEGLARALWHASPPSKGDLGLWGASLSEFVRASAQLRSEPFLADVAQLEWAMHECATARDAEPGAGLASLSMLTSQDPAHLRFKLAPGTLSFRSSWPVVDIVLAHRDDGPELAEVGQRVRSKVGQDAVVWRRGFSPQCRAAMPGEFLVLDALLGGHSVAAALEAAPELDFSQWLPLAVQSGLVLAVVGDDRTAD